MLNKFPLKVVPYIGDTVLAPLRQLSSQWHSMFSNHSMMSLGIEVLVHNLTDTSLIDIFAINKYI